jgi:nucleoside-diphosphate-sugar epimerase
VLVTGACGFVGRHLVRSLLQDGGEIWLIDDLSSGLHPDRWLPPLLADRVGAGSNPRVYENRDTRVVFFEADVIALLGPEVGVGARGRASLRWPTFTQVYHLASIVGGRRQIEEEPLQVGLDLAIDSVFFLWAWRSRRVERLLYASSSAAYPVTLQTEDGAAALQESSIDFRQQRIGMPDMTYGWSKLTGEFLAHLIAERHGIPACSIRPFSGYGEDQDPSYPIPAIAARAAAREDPLTVWGSGRQGRDFVHIDDCITAVRLAAATVDDGSGLNIGSGRLTTFLEVAHTFAGLARYEPEIRGTDAGPVGVHHRYADVAETARRLGWHPSVSLEEGFGRVLAAQEERIRATAGVG